MQCSLRCVLALLCAMASAAAPGQLSAQVQLAEPPNAAMLRAIQLSRSVDPTDRNSAWIIVGLLREDGHLAENSRLLQALADSLVSVAATHVDSRGRSVDAFGLMEAIDPAGLLFPVKVWESLHEQEANRPVRLTLLGKIANHPDRASAADALARAAERKGDSVVEVPVVIDLLLDMDTDYARAALRRMHASSRITEQSARAQLRELSRSGYRRDRR